MKRICLIGNNGFGKPVFDGQRIKVRTYKNVLESEGFEVNLVELDKPLKRLFKIFSNIKRGIRNCDIVILITSDNGEKILVPYINRLNKKSKKRFVVSQIGTSFLYQYIKSLTEQQKRAFFHEHNFLNLKPKKKTIKNLKMVDVILTETELINGAFSKFFSLDNCSTMTNFRLIEQPKDNKQSCKNKLVYLSRVTARKGIFDLLNVLKDIREKEKIVFSLDIYGTLYMDDEEKSKFNSSLFDGVTYRGEISQDKIINMLQQHDLLCFPTKCEGEGTPGCIIESLIAGTPILSSSFTQADELLKNNYNSLLFEFNNNDDMKKRLLDFFAGNKDYHLLRHNAFLSGQKFTYDYNRKKFLKIVCGDSNEK